MFGGENSHPLFHIHQPERGAVVRFRPRSVDRIDEREDVAVIIPSVGASEHEIPPIMFPFLNSTGGDIALETRFRIGRYSSAIAKFESAFNFVKVAARVRR